MKRRTRDFVALFNAFWYRDFPITPGRIDISRRALWTTHIAATVKLVAEHLGLYTCFETGGKTDAVIQDSSASSWAKVEWEWTPARFEAVNEIAKLGESVDAADTFFFIGYSRTDNGTHQQNLDAIGRQWNEIEKPLVVFLVTYSYAKERRHFQELQTHLFAGGKHMKVRSQEALPWQVPGTKWHASAFAKSDG